MKIIITGASGFIGSHLVQSLIEENEILTISRTKTDLGCPSIQSDINNIPNIQGEYDVFIHAAGQAHIQQNEDTRELFIQNNVTATNSALKLALKASVKHFILISSIASTSNDESDIYAKTKRESERLTLDFCTYHNIPYTIVRPVMVYGEYDVKGNMNKLIHQLKKGYFPLFNNGKTIKNMIYVQNLTFIIKKISLNTDFYNQALNVRDNETLTMKEICREIEKGIGKMVILIPIPKLMCLTLAHAINFVQKFGFARRINAESVRKLLIDVNVPSSESFNLPYTSHEGIKKTIDNMK